ncbi:MAG: HAMP domain-containing histidine kinase [Deltaproteobacteria bacterium]|nr:HAMP domain-containing histidine kinase [Deltaproteobacteria bacterium]
MEPPVASGESQDFQGELARLKEKVADLEEERNRWREGRVAERAAALATAHEDLKALLYIVSHDLRTPLINIKGFTGELRSATEQLRGALNRSRPDLQERERVVVGRALDEDLPEAIDFIDSSINRINHYVNTLLRLSHEGVRELHMESIEVSEVVRDLLNSLAFQLDRQQAVVRVGELPPVVADRVALEQILGNLLNNAVTYLDPRRAGKIELTGEVKDDVVILRVKDNGQGISQEDLPKVFAPFRRAGSPSVDGEGMGLAYAQAMARRHGGRIWCESEPGVGSTFSFSISSRLAINDRRSTLELLMP